MSPGRTLYGGCSLSNITASNRYLLPTLTRLCFITHPAVRRGPTPLVVQLLEESECRVTVASALKRAALAALPWDIKVEREDFDSGRHRLRLRQDQAPLKLLMEWA